MVKTNPLPRDLCIIKVQFNYAKISLTLISFLLIFFSANISAANITLNVDRTQIEMGDILNIKIIADFQPHLNKPDFNLLKDQFHILGTQRSNLILTVNGRHELRAEWLAQITPKRQGELIIPSFEVEGAISQPKAIFVSAIPYYLQKQTEPSFIKASVNKTAVKIQEEVIYTLRFYHRGTLISGGLHPPLFDNAIVKELQDQFKRYNKKINDNIYQVFEWSYAFYPQKSGEIIIPEQEISGRLQFARQLLQIQNKSQAITLQVKPVPANFPADQRWIPAKSLELTEVWQTDANQKIHVGDSITRTLTLKAIGQLASQLPELIFNNQTGLKIYPNAPQTNEKGKISGVISQKVYKMALVPIQAGQITLPDIQLDWWNTQTKQIETLNLPGKTLIILPALSENELTSPTENNVRVFAENEIAEQLNIENQNNTLWIVLTVIFAILWLITLGLLFRKKLKHSKQIEHNPLNLGTSNPQKNLISEWDELCKQNPLPAVNICYTALQKELKQHSFLTQDKVLMTLQKNLKEHLFNNKPLKDKSLTDICQTIEQLHAQHQKTTANKAKTAQLISLYPK